MCPRVLMKASKLGQFCSDKTVTANFLSSTLTPVLFSFFIVVFSGFLKTAKW